MNGAREAARLLAKALQPGLAPVNDPEYRELLAEYRGNIDFARLVDDVCTGLELIVLDVSERGIIVAPTTRESRFSLRMADLRQNLANDQKVALLMAHLAVCTVFYPTTLMLEDDALTPLPASITQIRDALLSLTARLATAAEEKEEKEEKDEAKPEADEAEIDLRPGWELLRRLPPVDPKAERASTSSVEGFIRMALSHMHRYNLVRLERGKEGDAQSLYTPTHRLRVHLRELTWPRLFTLVCRNEADDQA